jgi:endonuclease YncB( thermonuclease family)
VTGTARALTPTNQVWEDAARLYARGLGFPFRLPLNALIFPPWVPTVPAEWQLNADVESVHDGDTFNVTVQWGKRRQDVHQPIRLLGVAARELADPGGPEAAAALAGRPGLQPGDPVVLTTIKDDKFAPRWDCQVAYLVNGVVRDLALDLIAEQWAVPWNGRGPQPKPPWPRQV